MCVGKEYTAVCSRVLTCTEYGDLVPRVDPPLLWTSGREPYDAVTHCEFQSGEGELLVGDFDLVTAPR